MNNSLELQNEGIAIPLEDTVLSEALVETIFSDPNVRRYEGEFRTLLAMKEDIIFEINDFHQERTASFSLSTKGEDLYIRAATKRWLQSVLEKRIAQLEHYMDRKVIGTVLVSMGIGSNTTAPEIQDSIDALTIQLEGLDKKKDGLERKKINLKLLQLKKRYEKVSVDTPKRQGIMKGLQEMLRICLSAQSVDAIENDPRLSELKIELPEGYLALQAEEQLSAFKKLSISRKIIAVPFLEPQLDIIPSEEKITVPRVSKYTKKVQGLILASLIAVPIALKIMEPAPIISPITTPSPKKNPNLLESADIRKLAEQIKCTNLQQCFGETIKLLILNSPQDPFDGDTDFISHNYAKILISVMKTNGLFQNGLINHLNINAVGEELEFSTSDSNQKEWATISIKRSRRGSVNPSLISA